MRYIDKIGKFFLLLILFSVDLSAQTATTVSGYPVIDLSALNPLGAVLSSTEASARRTKMNDETPSNDEALKVGFSVSSHDGTWNAKMAGKFQVMRADRTVGPTDWATAYNLCKSYDGEGGGVGQWRLPTQRELSMMWILHPQLIGKGGFVEFTTDARYWSATENGSTSAWIVATANALMDVVLKSSQKYVVRCVRDL